MIIRKKQIVTATLALALGGAVFVNWYYTKPQTEPILNNDNTTTVAEKENLGDAQYVSATTANSDIETITDFKLKRNAAHDEAKETLNNIIKDQKSDSAAIADASDTLKILADTIKKEADLENLITAKISGECLVILDGDVCQVIVGKEKLNDNVSLQIKELIMNKTKISSKNITIIELKG